MAMSTQKACECFYRILNIQKPSLSSFYLIDRAKMTKNYILLKNHFERIRTTFEVGEYELIKQLLDKALVVLNEDSFERAYRRFGEVSSNFIWLDQEKHSCQSVLFAVSMVENLFSWQSDTSGVIAQNVCNNEQDLSNNQTNSEICFQEYHSYNDDDDDERAEESYHSLWDAPSFSQQAESSEVPQPQMQEVALADVDNRELTQQEEVLSSENCAITSVCSSRREEKSSLPITINDSCFVGGSSRRSDSLGHGDQESNQHFSRANANSFIPESIYKSAIPPVAFHQQHLLNKSADLGVGPLLRQHIVNMDNEMILDSSRTLLGGPASIDLFSYPSISASQATNTSVLQGNASNTINSLRANSSGRISNAAYPTILNSSSPSISSSKARSAFTSFKEAKKFFPCLQSLSCSSGSESSSSSSNQITSGRGFDTFEKKNSLSVGVESEQLNASSSLQARSPIDQNTTIGLISSIDAREVGRDNDQYNFKGNNLEVNSEEVGNSVDQIISIDNHYSSRGKVIFICKIANGSSKTKREYSIQLFNMDQILNSTNPNCIVKLKNYIEELRGRNLRKYRSLKHILPEVCPTDPDQQDNL